MKKERHSLRPTDFQKLSPYSETVLVDFYHHQGQKLRESAISPAPGSLELTYLEQLQNLALCPEIIKEKIPVERRDFTIGVYLRTLYHNQKLVTAVEPVIERLRDSQIPVIALKGLALAENYYKDLGARYMDDIDLLVPKERAAEALKAIHAMGWQVEASGISLVDDEAVEETLRFGHAIGFVSPEGQRLDLHWNLMNQALDSEWNRQAWETAVTIAGKNYQVLDSTLQLFHVCAHGYSAWGGSASIYWATDTTRVLRNPLTPIDWDRFVTSAETLNLSLTVQGALEYLNGVLKLDCLAEPLERLRHVSVSRMEYLEHKVKRSDISKARQSAWYFFFQAWREGLLAAPKMVTSLPSFVSRRLGARHGWQIPFVVPGKILQRILKSFGTT